MDNKSLKGWLYLVPAIAFLGAFLVYPLIDVFIYSVVFERGAFKKGYQDEAPEAFCGALRSRYYVLASGVMKKITPFEPEDI